MDDGVIVDNRKIASIVIQERQLYHPHPGQVVWLVHDVIKPVDESA